MSVECKRRVGGKKGWMGCSKKRMKKKKKKRLKLEMMMFLDGGKWSEE